MDSQTVAWIVVNLIGSVCVNLGQNVMKMGHNKRAALECLDSERPNIKRIREWQVGVVIFLAGGIANFVSFGYAPQSLLSALGSVQFVSNVVFASVVLKERVTVRTIGATACIVAGCVLLVVFTGSSSETLTVPVLMSYYSSPAYIAYLVAMLFVATGFFSLYRHGKRLSARGEARQHWDRLLPVSYALFCAPLGTQSVLFSKSVSVLLRTTLAGESQLGYWFTYVSLIAFVVTITFWVTRLNKSLKLFTAIVIVPTMQIGWTIFSILSGGIYFHEFEDYDSLETAMFVLGVVVIMAGRGSSS
uniref:Probable magnesium transporter n=1 Tax=Tetraselmis sp. GSL018 TaxID=582737 RepID=A0A061RQ90_9CHLO